MKFLDLKRAYQSGAVSKPDFIQRALTLHQCLFEYSSVVAQTDVHEISITADGVSFLLGDERIRLVAPPGEGRVAPIEVMNFDRYEPHETAVMDALMSRSTTVLDVGANIGWYAVRFAKRQAGVRVHAFEPLPQSHAFLQRNVAANGVGQQVTCYNFGLSDRSGSFEFFIAPGSGTNASLVNVAQAPDARRVVCLALTLDQWCSNHEVRPDFIKCDVEGAELLVFRGGLATLRDHRPIVFAELLRKWSKPFGYHPNDVLQLFRELGYACFAISSEGVRRISSVTDETVETNFAFLHEMDHRDEMAAVEELK